MSPSISGMGGASAPQVVSGASGYSSPTVKMGNLFQQIDTNSSGSISQSQFQQAFATKNPPARFQAAGANAIFSKLDPNRTGSVSKANFVSGMTSLMKSLGSAGTSSVNAARPTSAAQSLNDSLQSFLQMGSTASTGSGGVGTIINALG